MGALATTVEAMAKAPAKPQGTNGRFVPSATLAGYIDDGVRFYTDKKLVSEAEFELPHYKLASENSCAFVVDLVDEAFESLAVLSRELKHAPQVVDENGVFHRCIRRTIRLGAIVVPTQADAFVGLLTEEIVRHLRQGRTIEGGWGRLYFAHNGCQIQVDFANSDS